MSILINGIDMPTDNGIAVVIHPDGTAYSAKMFAGVCTEYLEDCTAVSIPSHLRLLWDRHVIETFGDAIIAETEKTGKVRATYNEIASVVADVPSIIQEGEKVL